MIKQATIILVLLVGTLAWGLTMDFDNYISVSPDNASNYGLTFKYLPNVASLVEIEMPYAKDNATFDKAELKVSDGDQHFKIPMCGKKNEQDVLFIAFRMDRDTLRKARIQIRFEEDGVLEGTVFRIECKEFVPEQ